MITVLFVPQLLWMTTSAMSCSPSINTSFISSAVMQSGMFMHVSIVLVVIYVQYFCVSVLWLCLDSQSVINNCGPGLNSILTL